MKSEWRVLSNPVGGGYIYQVYRLRDTRKVMYSGNIECRSEIFEDKSEAEKLAAELNKKGDAAGKA